MLTKISLILIFLFFLLVIIDAYYIDDVILTYIAIGLISVALLLFLGIILFDGDFSRICR
jgi:hypothetical protein